MAGTVLSVCGQRVWLATSAARPPPGWRKSSAAAAASPAALHSGQARKSLVLSLPNCYGASANAKMRSMKCCASPQLQQEESSDASKLEDIPSFDEVPSFGTVYAPKSNFPETPDEWKEKEAARIAEMIEKEGISIRRRPATGPAMHKCGDFEFKLENEGNTPRNILEEIVWNKDAEVWGMKERTPLATLMKVLQGVAPARDFVGALRNRAAETGQPGLIAEVKKASPSRGVIQPNFDPVRIAKAYEAGGAACLSVLTDEKYFQGSFENLKLIRGAGVECPLLCKEFIVDAWQLFYARAHGADAVLLIAAVLPDQDLKYLSKICKTLGLAVLIEPSQAIENVVARAPAVLSIGRLNTPVLLDSLLSFWQVHTPREMGRVLGLPDVQMIGINNRNLATFKVDLNNTVELLKGEHGDQIRERNILVVGESGLFTPADIKVVQDAGVGAVLVGESLVKQDNPTAGIKGLFGQDISRSPN